MRNLGRRLDRIEREAFPEDKGGMGLALAQLDDAFKPSLTDEQRAETGERMRYTSVGKYLDKIESEYRT